jgi:uncharacterized membrane protein
MARNRDNRALGASNQPAGIVRASMQTFSGPIPAPETLARYEEIIPGAAERILAMAENQSQHRMALESRVVNSSASDQTRGMWLGFLIASLSIGGGIYLVVIGKDGSGLASIITPLAVLAGVFVYGKSRQQKDLASKNQPLPR